MQLIISEIINALVSMLQTIKIKFIETVNNLLVFFILSFLLLLELLSILTCQVYYQNKASIISLKLLTLLLDCNFYNVTLIKNILNAQNTVIVDKTEKKYIIQIHL